MPQLNVLVDSAFSVDAGALILISHVDPDVQGHGTAHKRLDLTLVRAIDLFDRLLQRT